MGREIITLQFGPHSNFVGSHFWNIQEEAYRLEQYHDQDASSTSGMDHSILYRVTEQRGYEKSVPRTVIVDATGGLGGSTAVSSTDGETQPTSLSTWDGPVSMHASPQIQATEFIRTFRDQEAAALSGTPNLPPEQAEEALQRLSASARELQEPDAVNYWTDFLTAQLHPASVWQLPGIMHGSTDFEGYGLGRVQESNGQSQEEVAERLRNFAEECDSLQGFQMLVDDMSGFGSVAAQTAERLQEDFPKAPSLAFLIRPDKPAQGKKKRLQLLSQSLSLAELGQAVSLYTPLAPPSDCGFAFQQGNSLWSVSAACAAALDSVTLPTRLFPEDPGECDLHSLHALLKQPDPYGTAIQGSRSKILFCAASMPCPEAPSGGDLFTQKGCYSWFPDQAFEEWGMGVDAECIVLRGSHRAGRPLSVETASQALNASLIIEDQRAVRHCCLTACGMPVPLPFPLLHGRPSDLMNRATAGERVPLLGRLARSSSAPHVIDQYTSSFQRMTATAAGKGILSSWGYEQSDMPEIVQNLAALSEEQDDSSDYSLA